MNLVQIRPHVRGVDVDRETEFVAGRTGACGPNASAMAQRWADQASAAAVNTVTVYERMRREGLCSLSGAATLSALVTDAERNGYHREVLPYHEPMPEASWRDFFDAHVGQQAIVYETANGQALRDYLTGRGENGTNLRYHFILVAGWHPGGWSARAGRELPPGWWCSDGDNYDVGDVLQFYPDMVIATSLPCAAMAVYARVRIEQVSWTNDGNGNGGHDAVGNRVGAGLIGPLVATHAPDGKRSETPFNGTGDVFVDLVDGSVWVWSHSEGARPDRGGLVIEAKEAEIAGLHRKIAELEQQLASSAGQGQGDDVAVAAVKALALVSVGM